MPSYPTFRFPTPTVQANSAFAPAQVDFSKIASIADSYYGAKDDALRREAAQDELTARREAAARDAQVRQMFATGVPKDAQGNPDLYKAAERLIELGDPERGVEMLKVAGQESGRREDRAYRQQSLVPAAVREYQFYAGEERKAGRAPASFADWQKTGASGFTLKDRTNAEEGLRKEFSSLAKPYFDVRDAYTRVEASGKVPSAACDLALIFNYMKMLDPGSVVREGEFATAQNAAGVPDQVRNLFNRLLNGERMNPAQRDDFVTRARQLFQGQERQYQNIQNQYRGIAERIGVDPRNTILDFSRPPTGDGWVNAGDGVRIREKR